jgi:hypothetical protein
MKLETTFNKASKESREKAKDELSGCCTGCAFNDKVTNERLYFIKTLCGARQVSQERFCRKSK